MFRKMWIVLIGLLAFCGAQAWAQSVDELIAKNLESRGGAEKVKAVQSLKLSGKLRLIPLNEFRKASGAGQEMPMTAWCKRPNRVRMEMGAADQSSIFTFDGETALALRPGDAEPGQLFDDEGGMGEMLGLFLLDLADLDGPLPDYKTNWRSVEIEGKEEAAGNPAIRLKLTPKEGFVRSILLDAKTSNVLQTTRSGSDFYLETNYGDYRQVGGVQIAHSIEGRIDGELLLRLQLDSVEMNPAVNDEVFKPVRQK